MTGVQIPERAFSRRNAPERVRSEANTFGATVGAVSPEPPDMTTPDPGRLLEQLDAPADRPAERLDVGETGPPAPLPPSYSGTRRTTRPTQPRGRGPTARAGRRRIPRPLASPPRFPRRRRSPPRLSSTTSWTDRSRAGASRKSERSFYAGRSPGGTESGSSPGPPRPPRKVSSPSTLLSGHFCVVAVTRKTAPTSRAAQSTAAPRSPDATVT